MYVVFFFSGNTESAFVSSNWDRFSGYLKAVFVFGLRPVVLGYGGKGIEEFGRNVRKRERREGCGPWRPVEVELMMRERARPRTWTDVVDGGFTGRALRSGFTKTPRFL